MRRGVEQGAAAGVVGVGGSGGEHLGREGPRRGRLAGTARPAEQVGVGRARSECRASATRARGSALKRQLGHATGLQHSLVDLLDAAAASTTTIRSEAIGRSRRRRRRRRAGARCPRTRSGPSPSARLDGRSRDRRAAGRSRSGQRPSITVSVSEIDVAGPQPPRAALVGDGRVDEAVADDVVARLERRADHAADQVGARRAEEQQLGEGSSSSDGSLSSSRIRSAASVPPGSRSSSVSGPSASASSRAWVLLPDAVDSLERDEHRQPPSGGPYAT